MKTLILSLLLISNIALGSTNVTYLTKGKAAPYTGYLFTPENEQELRDMNERYKIQTELLEKKNELIQELNNSVKYNESELKKQKMTTTMKIIMYFGLGFLAGYATNGLLSLGK